ncbi:MAG: GTPase [Phycisphaerales bacterium]
MNQDRSAPNDLGIGAGLRVAWSLSTPASGAGAIAVFALTSDRPRDLDAALTGLGIAPVPVGRLGRRLIAAIDEGVVARWTPTLAHLMPHAGPAVTRAVARALADAGLPEAGASDPRTEHPEAADLLEARMLAALARAASPLGIDLLLDQPRRWRASGRDPDGARESDRDRVMRRLIDPPLVVALGPPNVGKSTLVNALAGRAVALVADEPGTTRDHVGVMLDCAGLVVRYVDTPGLRAPPPGDRGSHAIEAEAIDLARRVADRADLILMIGDAASPPVSRERSPHTPASLRVATRIDLGVPPWPHDIGVCARDGRGLAELVAAIRDALVPPAVFADGAPWMFWIGARSGAPTGDL